VLEEHKAKRAAKEHQEALTLWQARRDGAAELVTIAQTFEGERSSDILLGSGEALFCKLVDAALIEERRGAGHYQGRSQGVSIPVASIGGRSVRYRVGASRGTFVQGTPVPTAIDTGTVFVTNRRVIFQGSKQTRECLFAKLIGFQHDDVNGSTTFSVSNRQKPTTIHYGTSVVGAFDFRLDLALAHFRDTVDELVEQLQADLAQIDEARPVDDTDAPSSGPPAGGPAAIPAAPMPETARPAPTPSEPDAAPVSVDAGWYADPWGLAPLRWWDGTQWTGNVSEPPTAG
jgi:hypothetical protein